jgi:hypothetical protein
MTQLRDDYSRIGRAETHKMLHLCFVSRPAITNSALTSLRIASQNLEKLCQNARLSSCLCARIDASRVIHQTFAHAHAL